MSNLKCILNACILFVLRNVPHCKKPFLTLLHLESECNSVNQMQTSAVSVKAKTVCIYRYLLWIPRTILVQNFNLKSQCAYYMRTKYPGFFSPHPANVWIASFDDKHTGYIESMFSCFGKNLKTGGIILI